MAELIKENGEVNEELIQKLILDIQKNEMRFKEAKDLFTINEGELLPFVEEALQSELNPSAYERARKRISPINILPKVMNKLSTLYNKGVSRIVDETEEGGRESNQDIVDYYVKELGMDPRMVLSQEQFNLNKYTALEPYLDTTLEEPKPKLRVLPAHTFWVYSDNPVDPTEMTVFIKVLGKYNKRTETILEQEAEYKMVTLFAAYTDSHVIIFDSDAEVRKEFMQDNPDGINPYGVIPFIYIPDSEFSLIPNPDTDTKPLTILIPKLLTDLNYASQFLSHSIIYAIDADISNLSGNPDSIWHIKSDVTDDGQDTKNASIGTIKPEVDIEETLNLIKTQTQMWLDTKGLRASSVGDLSVDNAASGISKLIDESDASEVRETQATTYSEVERKFWRLLGIMHNAWLEMGEDIEENKKVIGDLKVSVIFPDQDIITDKEKIISIEKMKLDAKLTSHRRAVAMANPDLDDTEIDELMKEIKQDSQEFEGGMNGFLGNQSETTSSDTSNDSDATDNSESNG